MVDVKEIAKRFGLEVEEVESGVFKVLDNDKVVDVTEIMEELPPKSCVTIKTLPIFKKCADGVYSHLHASTMFIMLDFIEKETRWHYTKLAQQQIETAHNLYVREVDPMADRHIDTINSRID